MATKSTSEPLSLGSTDTIDRIREVLNRAGYCESRIRQALDVTEVPTFRQRRQRLPLYLWRTRAGTPLETLVHLFLLQQPVSLAAARRAVEPMLLEEWTDVGLLIRVSQTEVMATVELYPFHDLILMADWPERNENDVSQVMGIAASSRVLAQMTIRRQATRTLDLGTGCGVLAFLAASHSDQVVAVDRNPRAILMARFNTLLNGLSNVSSVEGNLFEPVHEQKFDLIVCNPPFVISPGHGAMHSHSGYPADQLCQTIIRTAPAFLREGGYCQLLCNWVQMKGQDWRERLTSWFAGTGCDVWILSSHIEDAAAYAMQRLSERIEDPQQVATQFNEWVTYYEREKIDAVGFGLISMHRSGRATNWFRCDPIPKVIGPGGESIEQGFRLRDFLEAHRDDQALLRARLRHAENLRWEQVQQLQRKGWTINASHLQLTSGLAYTGNVDTDVLEFVARCNGTMRLEAHLQRIAAASGRKIHDITPSFLTVVRRLVELGCLLPADDD